MKGAEALVKAMVDTSTGDKQKETWAKIAPMTSAVVDGICAAIKEVNIPMEQTAAEKAGIDTYH